MSIFSFNADILDWNLKTAQNKTQDAIGKTIQTSLQASCSILIRCDGKEWTGSGFHLGQGLIATASHVCPPEMMHMPYDLSVTFDGKTLYPSKVILSKEEFDSALIYTPEIADIITPVPLGDSDTLKVGDIIAVIGAPEGWHDTATVGRITNIHQSLGTNAPTEAWNDIFFVDADILEGVSGGMVIATDGKVYGSIMGVTGQRANIGIGENSCCPSNKIKKLLEYVAENNL